MNSNSSFRMWLVVCFAISKLSLSCLFHPFIIWNIRVMLTNNDGFMNATFTDGHEHGVGRTSTSAAAAA